MITNPIIPGFNPDPSICRKGDDYYIAVSSFEWLPGIPIYHSRDLKNWELYTHVLTDDSMVDLKKLPASKGVNVPCITYCEQEDLFYVVYGVINSMNAKFYDVDNFLVTARDIKGPWSEPVYIHSAGFGTSIFHDDDGRKYVATLECDTREGYDKICSVCLVEYSAENKEIIGFPKKIWEGVTARGGVELPKITKHGGYYYLMCSEGGTGYAGCITMGRSENIWGPYEGDPQNPIVTSSPGEFEGQKIPGYLKTQYFNPEAQIQKAGHGSYIDLPTGETYLVHLCARPFIPELRCTLGREIAIQKMQWTEDGWLRMADGSNIAKGETQESRLTESPVPAIPERDDFDEKELGIQYYSPRIQPQSFADTRIRPGYVRIRGQESFGSLNKVSILARKLTSLKVCVTTKMEFSPKVYQHSAGLIMYYDNMNYIYLRKYHSETLGGSALAILQLTNGDKREFKESRIAVNDGPVYLRLSVEDRYTWFQWSYDGISYNKIGPTFNTTRLSDEYCQYGEFTGTLVGIGCEDRMQHKAYADFDMFEYKVIGN